MMRLIRLFKANKPKLPKETGVVIDMTADKRRWGHNISFGAPGRAIGWGGQPSIFGESTPNPGDVILHEFRSSETGKPYVARLLVIERDYGAMRGVEDGWGIVFTNLGPFSDRSGEGKSDG